MNFQFCNNLLRDKCLQEYGACFSSLRDLRGLSDLHYFDYWIGYKGVLYKIRESRLVGDIEIIDVAIKGFKDKSMTCSFFRYKGDLRQQIIHKFFKRTESYITAYK